ncbi:TVP38/TMEM64 family protein [Pseudalkalibacillus caeni]|uniref:TVP38/TMEM64 family membrane protein n=1 Tax=Exobacillus caeni TaxID=2574798 RepID=A0A5R9EYQ5_9BACL|nr:TVP38/TMEM64 family protein [Pseudalkalibacillus caeni]TLS36432.1 TVP38/TMEM64 family protein [Pseudalkalibacillus caeni]
MKKSIFKMMLFIVGIILLFWIIKEGLNVRPEEMRGWILSFGMYAPLIYVGLFFIRPLVFFPASIYSIAGGLAFGALMGTVYTLVGGLGGAMVAFFISRKFGRNILQRKLRGIEHLQHQIEQRGFYYVLLLRIIPIINFDLLSYACGVSRVRLKDYILATLLGMLPGTIAFNFLGASFAKNNFTSIIAACLIFIVLFGLMFVVRKKMKNMERTSFKEE